MSYAFHLWQILAALGVMLAVNLAWSWFRDQYEPAWTGRFPRFTRRWYATGAHVRSRDMARFPDIYEVLEWGDDSTDVPWLVVQSVEEEDAPREWVPVTAFAAFQVRKLRPHWRHAVTGHTGLFIYRPLPGPDRIWRAEAGA